MGFGGSSTPAVPVYTEPEKPQTPKPVTEAATAARDAQREKASKAAGLQGSILTSPMQTSTQGAQQKTLLGQ